MYLEREKERFSRNFRYQSYKILNIVDVSNNSIIKYLAPACRSLSFDNNAVYFSYMFVNEQTGDAPYTIGFHLHFKFKSLPPPFDVYNGVSQVLNLHQCLALAQKLIKRKLQFWNNIIDDLQTFFLPLHILRVLLLMQPLQCNPLTNRFQNCHEIDI